jgi:hypothetical protein
LVRLKSEPEQHNNAARISGRAGQRDLPRTAIGPGKLQDKSKRMGEFALT